MPELLFPAFFQCDKWQRTASFLFTKSGSWPFSISYHFPDRF